MTEQKLVEVLENHGFSLEVIPKTGTILAGKNGCAAIVAVGSGKTVTGWLFQVGKNTLSSVDDAIRFSKKGIIE
jgi:hypothetical protein